jgi:hypothetical protein
MSSIISGKAVFATWLQRALLAIVAASLSGCFDDGSGGGDANPVQQSPNTGNQAPEVTGTPAATAVTGETYSFKPEATDADRDFLEYTITNKPSWATFDDETGLLTGVPTEENLGESEDITITVTDGKATRSIGPFKIRVNRPGQTSPSNQAPTITGEPPTSVLFESPYLFQPQALDADGDTLRFSISNRPSWADFSSTTGELSGTPQTSDVDTYANIVISVSDGMVTTFLPSFSIQVQGPTNQAPTISGTPATTVQAGQAYAFTPSVVDPDGDTSLVYSIDNQPRWANFSTRIGRLSGTPSSSDVGNYSRITISVTDGRLTTTLPEFSIAVTAAPVANRAPTISGTPATSVSVGSAYSFTPSGTDPDGDTLGYTIQNRPSWAVFETPTGRLSGSPTTAGTFSNIIITVTDGRLTASLPAFSITVLQATNGSAALSWTPPTLNTDGTSLTNLAGYRIVYGRSSTSLDQTVQISNPGASAYTLTGLSSGMWYFAVKAFNSAGAESNVSNVGWKTIP